MNLKKKKTLAAKTLKVGRERVVFVTPRLEEIKEVITKQDVVQLHKEGAIKIKEVKGRKKVEKRKRKRGPGKIKKKVKTKKQDYMALTRKLRSYVAALKTQGTISRDEEKALRKKIRNKVFRSKAHLQENVRVRKHHG